MQLRNLASFRFALLASLGVLHACGSSDQTNSNSSKDGVGETTGDGPSSTDPTEGDGKGTEGETTGKTGEVDGVDGKDNTETNQTPGQAPDGNGLPTEPMVDPQPEPDPPLPTTNETATPVEPTAAPMGTAEEIPDGGVVDPKPVDPQPSVDGGSVPPPGVTARPVPAECMSALPRDRVIEATSENFQCTSDSDCTDGEHGWCNDWVGQVGPGSNCNYGCVDDSDCSAGTVCDCGSPVGTCVATDCVTDADCGAGSYCARYEFDEGCGPSTGYRCTTDSDECLQNEDCASGICGLGPVGRICSDAICAIGRPFLVEGRERLATAVLRGDWLEPSSVDVSRLSASERQRLSEKWQRIALMEHASVAAFARFALQLMSVGAPPELLEATTAAMQDETEHAQLAFGLASAYKGQRLGPSALDIDDSLGDEQLSAIVGNTVLEGCIGETVAALEAVEGLAAVRDPAVRSVLSKVAKDEQRHAELAWKFVRWALTESPTLQGAVLEQVEAELAVARAAAAGIEQEPESDWLLRHGLLSDVRRTQLRAQVLSDVVLPSLRTLCATIERERSAA